MGTGEGEPNEIQADECPVQHATSDQRITKPLLYLLDDSEEARRQYLHKAIPLYRAALRNDWVAAQTIIRKDKKILRAAITRAEETVLHVAAGAKQVQFVKELMNLMDEEEVALTDCKGNTALCLAVVSGCVKIVGILMHKNAQLPLIRGGQGMTPLYMAALFGHAEIAWLLYPISKATLSQQERIGVFFSCLNSDLYGLALKLFEEDSALVVARDVNDETALHVLARKPLAFLPRSSTLSKRLTSGSLMSACRANLVESDAQKLTRALWKEILETLPDLDVIQLIDKPSRLLFEAAELGNFQFLVELIRSYPDLVWEVDEKNRTIFHVAVLNRHSNIFHLIHEIGSVKDVLVTFEDSENNNMLHLAGTSLPQHRQNPELGGTLQLQYEILWFEAMKKIMQPSYAEMKNSKGFTPEDVFAITHVTLFKDGEYWMKGTAKSCLSISLLVTIAVLLSSFNQAVNGKEKNLISSHVPNVSESIALVSSSVSILMFLSILTSNYGKMDFLFWLPLNLIIGLVTLFIAMSAMMLAFNGRLFIALPHGLKWAPTLTFIPVALFVFLQHYRLLSKLWDSTFVYRLLSGKGKYNVLHK